MTSSEESGKHQDRHQRAFAAGLGAGLGAIAAGPAGAIAGAALGPLLEPLAARVWGELARGGQRRCGEMLGSTCEAADLSPNELSDLIDSSERTQLMAGLALSAATRTTSQDKVRTLGRSLAAGLLATDDAKIDTEQLILAAIADIEVPHLSLLELLICWEPTFTVVDGLIGGPLEIPEYSRAFSLDDGWDVGHRAWTTRQIGMGRPPLRPVLASLLGTLQRHGLAVQDANTGEALERFGKDLERDMGRRIASQKRGNATRSPVPRVSPRATGMAQGGPTWSPTELGEQVFLRFREAGAEVPEVWKSPPAHQD